MSSLAGSAAPRVSVVVPAYNREAAIGRALQSVLAQTFRDFEIVVVDDCSTDRTAEAAAGLDPEVRVIRHAQNRGPGAARNTGIDAARGIYVAFLDSDDLWLPEKLARQVGLIDATADPERVLCTTQTLVVMDDGRTRIRPERALAPDEDWSEFLYLSDGFAQTSSFFLSRRLAARVRFSERLRQHEDSLFFLGAGAAGASHVLVAEPLTVWHHDFRADRLGYAPNLDRSRQFLAEAGPLLSAKARLGFAARYVAPLELRRHPLRALAAIRRALAGRAIGWGQVGPILLRSVLSERGLNRVRKLGGRGR